MDKQTYFFKIQATRAFHLFLVFSFAFLKVIRFRLWCVCWKWCLCLITKLENRGQLFFFPYKCKENNCFVRQVYWEVRETNVSLTIVKNDYNYKCILELFYRICWFCFLSLKYKEWKFLWKLSFKPSWWEFSMHGKQWMENWIKGPS